MPKVGACDFQAKPQRIDGALWPGRQCRPRRSRPCPLRRTRRRRSPGRPTSWQAKHHVRPVQLWSPLQLRGAAGGGRWPWRQQQRPRSKKVHHDIVTSSTHRRPVGGPVGRGSTAAAR
eukprot:7557830-Pyramimonas_sp.AAC.2